MMAPAIFLGAPDWQAIMSDSTRVVPVRPAAAPFVPLRGTSGVLREAKPLGHSITKMIIGGIEYEGIKRLCLAGH
jgi:hypothetical protein